MMQCSEQEMLQGLQGHFYMMQWENGPKVIDILNPGEPAKRHREWTEDDLRRLWMLKRKGWTNEEIAEELGCDSFNISRMWGRRTQWRERLKTPPTLPPRPVSVPVDPVRLADIRRVVAGVYHISETEFASSRRSTKTAEARQVYFFIARTFTTKSLPMIGEWAGHRDHSTVIHGIGKIKANFETYRAAVELCLFDLGLDVKAVAA
jgi:hypothetical protein